MGGTKKRSKSKNKSNTKLSDIFEKIEKKQIKDVEEMTQSAIKSQSLPKLRLRKKD
tara:strand:- start:121 stop:288 length:168 start_codon:yes stop_codon:yes gene_type:complete